MLQIHTFETAARNNAFLERLKIEENAFVTAFKAIVGVDWNPHVHGPQTLRVISHTHTYELIFFKQTPILLIESSDHHPFPSFSYTQPGPDFVPPFKIHPSVWEARTSPDPDYSI